MLTIHYFASIREALNKSEEQLEKPASVLSVADLIAHLGHTNPEFANVLSAGQKVLVAVNKTVVSRDYSLTADDEIAFFPPMTGG